MVEVNDDHYGDVIGLNMGIERAAAIISLEEVRRACTCFTCRIGKVRAADGDHIVSPYARCINEYSIKIAKRWVLICSSYAVQKNTLFLSQFICPTLYGPPTYVKYLQPDMSMDPKNGSRDPIPRIWIWDPIGSYIPTPRFVERSNGITDPGSHIVEGLSEIIDLKYFYTARSTGIQTRKQPIGVQLIKKLQLRKSNTNRGTTTILASLSKFEVR